MPRRYTLAFLTVPELTPPEAVSAAAASGYDGVGLRLLPVTPGGAAAALADDPALMRETRARMAATGIGVGDIEIVMLRPQTRVAALEPFLAAGAELGARHVLVAGYDPDEARMVASFAAFCEAAAGYGLTADLEFMPWTCVPDALTAARIAAAAGRPNGGVLVDAIHYARSGGTSADLAAIPREHLHYWQLCDAPAVRPGTTEELMHAARAERLFPGEGGLDLAGLARALPETIPVSLEIPRETLARTVPARERARRAIVAARRVLEDEAAIVGQFGFAILPFIVRA